MAGKITIEKLAGMIQQGFRGVQKDISGLKSDVHEIKSDIRGLKSDVRGIKSDIEELKSDVAYLKARVMEIGIILEKHEEILLEHSLELKLIHKKIDEFTDSKSQKSITYEEFLHLTVRVDSLEKKVKEKIHK